MHKTSTFPSLINYRMFQADTESSISGIESYARTRFCRTAPPPLPLLPPPPLPPIRRRLRWAAARVLDQVVPCWASPARQPRSWPTSTVTRRPASCRSSTSVMAGTQPICSYCAPSVPPGCWTSPRSYPAITRNGVSRIGRYPPRTLVIKTSSSTSRKRSNSSVSVAKFPFFSTVGGILTLSIFRVLSLHFSTKKPLEAKDFVSNGKYYKCYLFIFIYFSNMCYSNET